MSHVESLHHPRADHYQVVCVTGHLPHHHHLSQCEPGLPPSQARPASDEWPAHPHGHPLLSDQGQGESQSLIANKNHSRWILFQLLRQDKITYSDSSSASAWDDSSQMTSTSCSPSPSSASSFSQESLSSEVVKSSSNKVGKCIVTNL